MDPASQHGTSIFWGNLPAYANTVFCHTPLSSSANTGTVILSFCHTPLIYIIKFNNFTLSRYLYKIYFMPFNITEENLKKRDLVHLEMNSGLAVLTGRFWSSGFLSLDFNSQINELILSFICSLKFYECHPCPKCWENKIKLSPSKTNLHLLNDRYWLQGCESLL